MKDYTVIADEFWHKGILHFAGDTISVIEASVKYLTHALAPKADVAPVEAVIAAETAKADIVEAIKRKPAKADADKTA